MKYRSEIDGLRAIAVVPVIFFHAGFELFSGGFVGVDVFFVISGYLITTIIVNEMDDGKFSLLNFYERRARRILPALFCVVLCCIPFAWFLLLPSDMKDFAQSLVAVSTFSSNILFWRESGYFDTAAELKPLLHTWSLAVEEQFYILFPLFLIVAWRFGKRAIVWTLIASFAISLAVAQWGAYNKPAATFFLLPTRAWELLIGSFAAFYLQRGSISTPLRLNNLLSAAGLLAILYAVFAFDEATPFPSLYALVPTVGTVLVILFALKGTLTHTVLSLRGVVAVGLISYSLYLWHQPVFAFWRHYSVFEPTHTQMSVLSLLCLPLAFFTYRFVEAPFRGKSAWLSRDIIFRLSGFTLSLLTVLGAMGHFTNGLSQATEIRSATSNIAERISVNHGLHRDCEGTFNSSPNCYTSQEPEVLLWGDSFAMHLAQGIIASEPAVRLQQHTKSVCSPLVGVALINHRHTEEWAQGCIAFNEKVLDWVSNNPSIELVILSSPFGIFTSSYLSDVGVIQYEESPTYLLETLRRTVERIRSLGADVVVVSPTPVSGRDNGRCVARAMFRNLPEHTCDFEDSGRAAYSYLTAADEFVPVYWLSDDICHNSICDANQNGVFIFRDGGHLSKEGSEYLGEQYNWLQNWRELAQISE